MLALLAAKQNRGKTSSVNIFDFSDIEKEPVKAKSSGTVTPVNPPTGGEDIDVTVSIKSEPKKQEKQLPQTGLQMVYTVLVHLDLTQRKLLQLTAHLLTQMSC